MSSMRALGRYNARLRAARGHNLPMLLPQHDVFFATGRANLGHGGQARSLSVERSRRPLVMTVNDAVNTRPYRAANTSVSVPATGNTSDGFLMFSNNGGGYFQHPYTADNALIAGDFFVRVRMYLISALTTTSVYHIFGNEDNVPTSFEADTGWAMRVGASSKRALCFSISNGTTRTFHFSTTDDLVATGWYDLVADRYNGTLSLYVNGSRVYQAAESKVPQVPPHKTLRLGQGRYSGFSSWPNPQLYDFAQYKRRSVALGSATIPTPKYPWPN